jgi:hypothetical protein
MGATNAIRGRLSKKRAFAAQIWAMSCGNQPGSQLLISACLCSSLTNACIAESCIVLSRCSVVHHLVVHRRATVLLYADPLTLRRYISHQQLTQTETRSTQPARPAAFRDMADSPQKQQAYSSMARRHTQVWDSHTSRHRAPCSAKHRPEFTHGTRRLTLDGLNWGFATQASLRDSTAPIASSRE